MPVYLKQWLDGDFTLVFAKDLEDAVRMFEQTACVDEATILQLNAGDLTVNFTLSPEGNLVSDDLTPAVEEARRECYPALMRVLDVPASDSEQRRKAIGDAVEDEMKVRKQSKLSAHLLSRKKARRAKGK